MPGTPLSTPDDDADVNSTTMIEDIPLVLPSALNPEQRLVLCKNQVADYEQQFRLAQIEDSLTELRRVRRIRCTLLVNHRSQIAGQGQRVNTRSRSVIDSVQERIEKFARRYRAGYEALLRLNPSGDWSNTYLELKDSDNRGPGKELEEGGAGDGSYSISWIWLANPRVRDSSSSQDGDQGATQEEVNEVMRVEWATSLARMERWAEEVELVEEEMRRVVMFLEWKSTDWLTKREARLALATSDIQSGLDGYARKQAAVYHHLALSFLKLWHPTLVSYRLNHSWVAVFLQRQGVSLTKLDTPTPRDKGIFKLRVLPDMNDDQSDTQQTPQVDPQVHSPHRVDDVVEDVLLDEADSDSSSDLMSSDTDESEPDYDDLNYDDLNYDFDYNLD
jgi:hypothetical protein